MPSISIASEVAAANDEDDRAIVAAVKRGKTARFEELIRRHNQRLFRIGIAHLRQPDLVEDAMQNTYLHAFTHLEQFAGRSAFATWLSRIMINECLMQLRTMRRREAALHTAGNDPTLPRVDSLHAGHHVSAGERRELLERAVTGLPEAYRTVFVLREIQHLDTEETADLLALSLENVKVRLHRARELLKRQLLDSAAGIELFTYGADNCRRFTAASMERIGCRGWQT